MRKAITWFIIAILLVITIGIVRNIAHAQQIVGVSQSGRCLPSEVYFKADKGQGDAYGCAIVRNDTIIIFTLLINQTPAQAILVPKANVDSITLLRPTQTAVMRGHNDPP